MGATFLVSYFFCSSFIFYWFSMSNLGPKCPGPKCLGPIWRDPKIGTQMSGPKCRDPNVPAPNCVNNTNLTSKKFLQLPNFWKKFFEPPCINTFNGFFESRFLIFRYCLFKNHHRSKNEKNVFDN